MSNDKQPVIIYEPPSWQANSNSQLIHYYLEVLKSGSISGSIPLDERTRYTLGRNGDLCDLALEHPSVSRVHAILQFHSTGRLFLYDMGSTHGSFWNTKRVKPFVYVPVRLGDQLRFGESTRIYVLCSEDQRAEQLEQSRSQQQEQFIKTEIEKSRKKQKRVQEKTTAAQSSKRRREENHEQEDEQDDDESQDEEALFEGEDTRARLRIEEEVNEDALFDDEDEYFDRTIQKKLQQKESQVETIDTLLKKRAQLDAKLTVLHKQLSSLHQETINGQKKEAEEDSLDSYMSNITSAENEKMMHKLQEEIAVLKVEQEHLNKLIEIARPAIQGLKTKDQEIQEFGLDLIRKEMFVENPNKKRKLNNTSEITNAPPQLHYQPSPQSKEHLSSAPQEHPAAVGAVSLPQQDQKPHAVKEMAASVLKSNSLKPTTGLYIPQDYERQIEEDDEDEGELGSYADEQPTSIVQQEKRTGNGTTKTTFHAGVTRGDDDEDAPLIVELNEAQQKLQQKAELKALKKKN